MNPVRMDAVGAVAKVAAVYIVLSAAADAFERSLRAQGQSRNSVPVVASCLRKFTAYMGNVEAEAATQRVVDYLVLRSATLKPNSFRAEFSHLRQFFNFCFYEGWIERNPFARMRTPPKEIVVTQPLSDAEILALLEHSRTVWGRAAIILLLGSGMRIGELSALRWQDVGEGTLLLHGKGNKQRIVAPGAAALRALMTLPRDSAWVFPFTYEHIAYRLRRLSQRSGVCFHPHQLRHTFANRFLREGGSIENLAEILGHAQLDSTLIYVRAFRREAALAAQVKFNPADRLLIERSPHRVSA